MLVPSTACVVLSDSEEVLLQLRSDTKNWGCPGGIMDFRETAVQSVLREVREETGLILSDPWLFGVYSGAEYEARYPNGDEIAVVQLAFVAERYEGELGGDDESLDLRFFSFSSLPENIAPHHQKFLRHFHQYLNGLRSVPVVR